jgi:hypothetical protein
MQRKLLGIISVDFDINTSTADHIFCICQHLKKLEYNEALHQLFVDFKKFHDSGRTEVLYHILECGIPLKLVTLMKLCLNETYSRVWVGKHMSHTFPINTFTAEG